MAEIATSRRSIALSFGRRCLLHGPLIDLLPVIGVGLLFISVVGTAAGSLQTGKSMPHETKDHGWGGRLFHPAALMHLRID